MSTKPIMTMSINAPKKGYTDIETFVKFVIKEQYHGVCKTWPNHDIHLKILIYEDSEDANYFVKLPHLLKKYCPMLTNKFVLVEKE